jgi:hypothetical protein
MAGFPQLVAELMKHETVGDPNGLSVCQYSKGCAIDSAKKKPAVNPLWHCGPGKGKGHGRTGGPHIWCICTRVGGVYQAVTSWMMLQDGWAIKGEYASVSWLTPRRYFSFCRDALSVRC